LQTAAETVRMQQSAGTLGIERGSAAEQLSLRYVRCRPSRFLEVAAFMYLRERTAAFLR
jgi:hypothetical protein